MKKQELIHLHGLLAQVRNHHQQKEGTTVDQTAYDELGIRPTSIHKSKTQHKRAVFALAESIIGELERVDEQPVSAAAD